MSKNLRWEIAFQSVKGRDYKLLIYDDDWSGGKVSIQAGETPFVTDEDTNTDFFSPVRGSTGTISILDPNGTKLNSMIPDNNTARPVRLLGKRSGGGNDIMWQGFLTCNTYSQGYTDRPQICELQVASLLEASDSIAAKQSDFSGLMSIREIIYKCIEAIQAEYGNELICDTLFFPKADWRILIYHINTSIFFEEKEVANENSITYITVGKSIKEILTTICTFMGWCVRECPNKVIAFQRMNDQDSTNFLYIDYLDFADITYKSLSQYLQPGTKDAVHIQDVVGRGIDHTIETAAGAKEVAVIANTKGENWELKLPEVPAGSLKKAKYELNYIKDTARNPRRFTYYVNTDKVAHSNITYAVQKGKYDPFNRAAASYLGEETSNPDLLFTEALGMLKYNGNAQASYPVPYNDVTIYSGAFLLKYYYEDIEADGNNYYPVNQSDFKDGLYVCFLPNLIDSVSTVHPIFKIQTTKSLSLGEGYLQLTCDVGAFIWRCAENTAAAGEYALLDSLNTPICSSMPRIKFALRYGEYCLFYSVGGLTSMVNYGTTFIPMFDGSKFMSNYSLLLNPTIQHEEGILVPVTAQMQGQITLEIYAEAGMTTSNLASFYAAIFNSLGVKFIPANGATPTRSGGNNAYREILSVNFNDEVTVNTDLATDMNNNESPHILMYGNGTDKLQTMTYSYPSGDATNRPERDLLARLAKYYKKKRRTYNIEVEPINDQLPVTRVSVWGLPTQPIAEARDYRLDKSTITLMEESANSET